MGSNAKKKTTMAKLARENRLRERRLNKQAKKDARKQASADVQEGRREGQEVQATSPDPAPAALEPAEPTDPGAEEVALRRLPG